MIDTDTRPDSRSARRPGDPERPGPAERPTGTLRTLLARVTRLELMVGALVAVVMGVLVLVEPDILEAPFQNGRTLLFTVGGTGIAAAGFALMLWLRVPAPARLLLLLVPFVAVNWWLLSPYFVDDVVDESFATSISEQTTGGAAAPTADPTPAAPEPQAPVADPVDTAEPEVAPAEPAAESADPEPAVAEVPETTVPTGPVLLGAGQFVGLAGHDGTGDAGLFRNPDGSHVLRFENFDIENGPDLEVYLVPGADQTQLAPGSIHLGELKGNVGDQNYELPADLDLAPGAYTALVWCEAFSVEFVGATITV